MPRLIINPLHQCVECAKILEGEAERVQGWGQWIVPAACPECYPKITKTIGEVATSFRESAQMAEGNRSAQNG